MFTVLLLTVGVVAGATTEQVRPVCDIVSEKDAVAVIGPLKQKQTILGDDQCVFTAEGLTLMINRLRDQEAGVVEMMLQVPKNRAQPGDVVKDEAGIGQRAVSETRKGSVTILAAKGNTLWTFGVQHVYTTDVSEMLPKLRALAQKIVDGK